MHYENNQTEAYTEEIDNLAIDTEGLQNAFMINQIWELLVPFHNKPSY